MDAERFAELQEDQQREETADTALHVAIESELVDVHTGCPGIIKSFDAETQSATVQPAIRRLFIGRGYVDLPQCLDVPVQFPRGGNFVITFPVTAGDECWLSFGERCIDFWWDRGGVQNPDEPRMHDLSDAVAHLGFSSRPRVPSNISGDALEIRTLDGRTVVRVEAGAVVLGSPTAPQPAVLGDVLDVILKTIAAHTHPETGTTTGVSATLATFPEMRSSSVKVGT